MTTAISTKVMCSTCSDVLESNELHRYESKADGEVVNICLACIDEFNMAK